MKQEHAMEPSIMEEARRGASMKGLASYDGFRGEEKASVKLERIEVYQGKSSKEKKYSTWDYMKFSLWALLGVAVVAGVITLAVLMSQNSTGQSGGVSDDAVNGESKPTKPEDLEAGQDTVIVEGETAGTGSGAPPLPPGIGIDLDTGEVVEVSDKDGTLVIPEQNPPFEVPDGWKALWWDEFDGTILNPKWWSYELGYGQYQDPPLWQWGNDEEQYYTDRKDNVQVSDGTLKITARREVTELFDGFKFNYTSGRIVTKGRAAFYGGMTTADGAKWDTIKIEARLKAPQSTQGLWAAYWMLPAEAKYGVWATSGEIDIFEMKNEFKKNNLALHYGGPYPKYNRRYNLYERHPDGILFNEDFTVVTLEWSPDTLKMYMNGVQYFEMSNKNLNPDGWYSDAFGAGPRAPFDTPFYFVLNLAVGGRYPGDTDENTITPNTFEVDYIRVLGKE